MCLFVRLFVEVERTLKFSFSQECIYGGLPMWVIRTQVPIGTATMLSGFCDGLLLPGSETHRKLIVFFHKEALLSAFRDEEHEYGYYFVTDLLEKGSLDHFVVPGLKEHKTSI